MTQFSLTLFWCVVQTSLVALISVLLAVSIGRRYRGATRVITCWGLAGMLLLTLAASSPWPRWNWSQLASSPPWQSESADERQPSQTTTGSGTSYGESTTPLPQTGDTGLDDRAVPDTFVDTEISAWAAFVDEFNATSAAGVNAPKQIWLERLGWFLLLCAGGGLIRFAMGWIGLKRLTSNATAIKDETLLAHTERLKRELGCRKSIQILQSRELNSAATIGWKRPLLLLPVSWTSWSHEERQSVLAHEIAHIHRGDFLVASIAQFCLALHFYHPLVHWLVHRLRLEMEFDADSLAATSVGSTPAYATTLASMAIRDDETKLGWPARSFLPTRNTFMRRLEMLRNSQRFPARSPLAARWFCIAALAVSFASAIGLRASTGLEEVLNEPAPVPSSEPIRYDDAPLTYVPNDADAVFTIKPAELAQVEPIGELVEMVFGDGMKQMGIPFDVDEVARLTTYFTKSQLNSGPSVMVVTLREPQSKLMLDDRAEEKTFLLHSYYAGRRFAWMQPDEHTLLVGPEEQIKLLIVNGPEVNHSIASNDAWSKVADAQAAVFLQTDLVETIAEDGPTPPWMSAFAPLWNDADHYIMGLRWDDSLSLTATAQCADAKSAESVKRTCESILTLAKNAVRQLRVADDEDPAEAAMLRELSATLESLIASTNVAVDDEQVLLSADIEVDRRIIAMLSEATLAARKAASRTQDMNNLKQIMLAMHNYHDVHKRLPPAVVYHRTNSGEMVPHSWRVELLPYLEASALYEAYRMDEPWDSDHNLKILEQIPDVFRSSLAEPGSKNTSYFVIVSEGGMFADGDGAKFRDITDGLSNTIAVVEAKRDIPWTKPEDLKWNPDEEKLAFGGWHPQGFLTGLGDGSVRFVGEAIDRGLLDRLIRCNDGQPVEWNAVPRTGPSANQDIRIRQ